MRSKSLSEKGRNIFYLLKLLPGFQHLSNFIQIQSKPVDRCVSGNGNIDMSVIYAGNGEFVSIDRPKCINAKLNAGEKLRHGFLNRDFLFYGFSGFLGVLIVLSGTGNKLLENAILQFKAHCSVVVDLWSQSFHKIRIVVARMELDKFHLFFLLVSEKCVIVKVSIADDVRSDLLGEVRLSGTRRTSENQIF